MNKGVSRVLSLISAAVVIAGCSSEQDTRIMAPLPVVQNQFTPDSQWTTSVGNGVGSYFSKLSPVYAYGSVFAASRQGEVKSIDPDSGKTLWDIDISENDARLSGGLTAAYESLFIGSENGILYALSTKTGQELWKVNLGSEILSRPLAEEGLVIVNTSRGDLIALDSDTGNQVWLIENEVPTLTLRGESTPTAMGGGVFWGMANGRLGAAVISRGQVVWQVPISTPKGSTELARIVDVDSSPLVIDSILYIVGINGQLVAIDLGSGKPLWKRDYSSAVDISSDGRSIFVVAENDHIFAVERMSGTLLWKSEALEYRQLSSPMLIDNYLVFGDAEGYLHWMNPNTGDFVSQQLISEGDGIAVPPLFLGDGFVVINREGDIEKFTLPSDSH